MRRSTLVPGAKERCPLFGVVGARLCCCHLVLRFVLHDVPRNGACRDGIWAGKVHLSRPAATGKITVLRADDDLVAAGGDPRAGVDAGAAARLNYDGACLLEDIEISLAQAVVTCVLGAKLNVKLA